LETVYCFTILRAMAISELPATSLALTRTDETTGHLRRRIVQGDLPPGTLLAEASVARQLGVSRVPVREALFTLEREGLVEFSPTGRAYVRNLGPADFEELYLLRLALEPLAAKLASPHLQADPTALEQNIRATEQAGTLHELTQLDLDFHQIILEAAGQRRLGRLWRSLRSELECWLTRLHRTHQTQTHDTRQTTVKAHLEILDCFLTQPPAASERLMRTHIQGWREWLPTMPDVAAS
jgi:DNA-binding GntR family transcriptional regulator